MQVRILYFFIKEFEEERMDWDFKKSENMHTYSYKRCMVPKHYDNDHPTLLDFFVLHHM